MLGNNGEIYNELFDLNNDGVMDIFEHSAEMDYFAKESNPYIQVLEALRETLQHGEYEELNDNQIQLPPEGSLERQIWEVVLAEVKKNPGCENMTLEDLFKYDINLECEFVPNEDNKKQES